MKLWQLLIGVCFSAAVGGALAPPRIANAGVAGYMLAIAVGVTVGVFCSWIMWRMHEALVPNLLRRLEAGDPLAEWYGCAFYVSKVWWIMLASVFGYWVSATLLRTVL